MKRLTTEEMRLIRERGETARRQMQEIIDRVEARRRKRQAWRERSLLRRLLSR